MLPKSLRPLIPYFKKYRRSYVVGAICVFLMNGTWILFPLVIRQAVDDLHLGITRHKLVTYALLLLAVAATKPETLPQTSDLHLPVPTGPGRGN